MYIYRIDWHDNGWPSVTLNGRFTSCAIFAVAGLLVLMGEWRCTVRHTVSDTSSSHVQSGCCEVIFLIDHVAFLEDSSRRFVRLYFSPLER